LGSICVPAVICWSIRGLLLLLLVLAGWHSTCSDIPAVGMVAAVLCLYYNTAAALKGSDITSSSSSTTTSAVCSAHDLLLMLMLGKCKSWSDTRRQRSSYITLTAYVEALHFCVMACDWC
jgi:hypothetical protein